MTYSDIVMLYPTLRLKKNLLMVGPTLPWTSFFLFTSNKHLYVTPIA